MTKTATYTERKKFEIYDGAHALLYLNEEPGEVANPESGETAPGYAYTGTETDGGTMIEAAGVTAENIRDKFVAGLIGLRYDIDAQIATLANGKDTPEHSAELEQFAGYREECKAQVAELLAREV